MSKKEKVMLYHYGIVCNKTSELKFRLQQLSIKTGKKFRH